LYNYPILMAVEILIMEARHPVVLSEQQLKKLARCIPTDSTPVEAPKDPDSSNVFQILEQFAAPEIVAETRRQLRDGVMGWGS
jgi:tryptophanyl-tRNA synthetase